MKRRRPRHPVEVTIDRLGQAVETWGEWFRPEELDMVGVIIARLEVIAEHAAKS